MNHTIFFIKIILYNRTHNRRKLINGNVYIERE